MAIACAIWPTMSVCGDGGFVRAPRSFAGALAEPVAVEHLDILLRQGLPQIFVADAPRRIACAAFLRPEDAELDVRMLHHLSECGGHLLIALIKRSHAADPVQHIHR